MPETPRALSVLDAVNGDDLLGVDDVVVPNPRRSPLHDAHVRAGASIVEFGGCLWVDRYPGGVAHEYRAANTGVGVIDVSLMTQLSFTGSQAAQQLQRHFTNDVLNLAAGRLRYGAVVDDGGRVVDDAIVYKQTEDQLLIVLNIDQDELPESVEASWSAPEVDYRNISAGRAILQIQGPEAVQSTAAVLDVDAAWVPPFFGCRSAPEDNLFVGRCGFTGTDSVELIGPASVIQAAWDGLVARGVEPFGISTIEYLRVEGGMICNGHEFTPGSNLPYEIGLGRFVKPSVAPMVAGWPDIGRPVQPHLHWVLGPAGELDLERLPTNGDPITIGGTEVGRLTSTILSPAAGRIVALAMVDPLLIGPIGDGVTVDGRVGELEVALSCYEDSPFG